MKVAGILRSIAQHMITLNIYKKIWAAENTFIYMLNKYRLAFNKLVNYFESGKFTNS